MNRPSLRSAAPFVATALATLGFAAALVWTLSRRGPWYDEFYTWFVTRPDRPLLAALRDSWLADNHPPLFYLLAWAGGWAAGQIETLRLLNLAALAATLAAGWVLVRRRPRLWLPAGLVVLVLAASSSTLAAATELRSYFLSTCAAAVVMLALVSGWLSRRPATKPEQAVLWGAVLIGFNLHIVTSLILGAVLVPFVAAAGWWRRDLLRRWLPAVLGGGLVFVAITALQAPHWQGNTVKFWIPAGAAPARWAISYALQRIAEANLPLLAAALAGTGWLAWQGWRNRRVPPALAAMVLLGLGVALAAALLIGLHLIRPLVMERYLAALLPAIALGMALPGAAALRLLAPRLRAAVLLLAAGLSLLAAADHARALASRPSWNGTAERIGQVVRACPASAVHIAPELWNAYTLSLPPADNRMVMTRAYRLMAQRHGIVLEPPASRRLPGPCPALFWAEHDTSREWNAAAILAALRARGFALERIWLVRIGDGWIASDRPLATPPPAP